jgi:hypothetical protein
MSHDVSKKKQKIRLFSPYKASEQILDLIIVSNSEK